MPKLYEKQEIADVTRREPPTEITVNCCTMILFVTMVRDGVPPFHRGATKLNW